ncbi:MAG TPA: toxin-antitoxin system YwqK family antitoxin [Phaeodactylibacter sp.]|nr:toxin-antitoxin system YwqK family antitoxin [Phaeodactylibacter sp.]
MKQLVHLLPFFLLWASCSDSANNADSGTAVQATDPAASVDYELESVPGADYQLAFRYNEKGRLVEEGRMRDGQKVGTWITYHSGGDFPAKMVTFANGNYHGPYFEFNDRGQINLKAHYRNNLLHGDWASYRFGRPLKKAHYKDGALDGLYSEYDMKSGKIQKEIHYKDGKQHGTFRFYDLSGNVIAEYEYKNGEKISGGMKE